MLFNDDELGDYVPGSKRRIISHGKPKTTYSDLISARQYAGVIEEPKTFEFLTDDELLAEAGGAFVFDEESSPNYFMIGFESLQSGKYVMFEDFEHAHINRDKLHWLLANCVRIGFNNIKYDDVLLNAVMKMDNFTAEAGNLITRAIIEEGMRPKDVADDWGFVLDEWNGIDLIEVAPLSASLKTYAGRLHAKRMQNLPFVPGAHLSPEEINSTRTYCFNDLANTKLLAMKLKQEIDLRVQMSDQYGLDLRSKSDAQIAEHVISSEMKKVNPYFRGRPKVDFDATFKYKVPPFLDFKTDLMKDVLRTVANADFTLDAGGHVACPPEISALTIPLGFSTYNLVIGGLHSTEENVSHYSDDEFMLMDIDVTSFYPFIILLLRLYPKHMGEEFLEIYNKIVQTRLDAKRSKKTIIANSLKIVINGSFGKFGSMFSSLYSPDLMIGVTMTGQLSLLLLIESIELAGISVVSANTDGVVIKCPRSRYNEVWALVHEWERKTGFNMEETRYRSTHALSVNEYFAITEDGEAKRKGQTFKEPDLSKNPVHVICAEAVIELAKNGTPIADTVHACKDVTKFVVVRNAKGGAEKDGVYIGNPVRWYYSTSTYGVIQYCNSGNKVPMTDGAWPLMMLPDELPNDIDYGWYIMTAEKTARKLGLME